MMPVENGVRLFDELDRLLGTYEAVVPEAVVAELDELSTGGGEEATAASVGRDLADRCTVVSTEATFADDAVVELADAVDYVVTNDRPLRRRLRERDVSTICLRGRAKLAITN
jgi:rRNA-processing protein FCF1